MGTIKKGILGGFSGKVGNVVGASWKGIDYIRSLPSSIRNPRTRKQVTQRNKFSLMGKFMRAILPVIRVGFKNSAGAGNSAFSAAMSYNINNAVKGEYPDFGIDFAKVAVARGGLYVANNVITVCEAGRLNCTWDTDVINNASTADRAMILAYNPGSQEAVYDLEAGTRGDDMRMLRTGRFYGEVAGGLFQRSHRRSGECQKDCERLGLRAPDCGISQEIFRGPEDSLCGLRRRPAVAVGIGGMQAGQGGDRKDCYAHRQFRRVAIDR